jgi:hypothetical protein
MCVFIFRRPVVWFVSVEAVLRTELCNYVFMFISVKAGYVRLFLKTCYTVLITE